MEALTKVADTQQGSIRKAAEAMADAVENGQSIFAFGASHSFILAEEMTYRTGGLMLVNPIYPHGMNLFVRPLTATSRMERVVGLGKEILASAPIKQGDLLFIASTSGRNAVVIDMANAAQERGITTVAITSVEYSRNVTSRHPSGKKLMDLCDIVIDNCAPHGDAAVSISGFPHKVGPLSSVMGCAIVHAIVADAVQMLVDKGIDPPVFVSANLDHGDAYNARLLEENKHRIHYMD
ncbi:MAG: SIS domain-containing protein [Armatimonadetes bacterium]|nr:SIS domain-containing protein [Armatimonadota bacterium]